MASERTVFHRHRIAILVAINAIILALAAGAGFLIHHARQSDLGDGLPPERRFNQVRTAHPVYGHGLVANGWTISKWGEQDYLVQTNSLGFKDADMRAVPPRGDSRLLLLGDSITEGMGFSFEDSFAGRIATELAKQGIDVLNAAVASYSPTIYLRKTQYLLDEVGLEFDELWVFLDISDIQDEAWIYFLDEQGNVQMNNVGADGTFPYIEAYLKDTEDDAETSERYAINRTRSIWTIRDDMFETYAVDGLRKAKDKMTALAQLSKERGFELGVVIYPWPDQIRYWDISSPQRSHWHAWAEDNGVKIIDAFPDFLAGVDQSNWKDTITSLFIAGDTHYSQQGHELMARTFLRERARLQRAAEGR